MAREVLAPFRPLPWQVAAWRDRAFILLLTGKKGGGKSHLAAEKVHAYLLKYPGAVALGLRKAREFATKSIVPRMERVIGADPRITYGAQAHTFAYANGSRMYVGGMKDDSQREALRSMPDVDILWMEEANAFSEADFGEAVSLIRGNAAPWRQIILSTNPDGPLHWIKLRLMDGGEASIHRSGFEDNPYNPPDYARNLQLLVGIQRQRLVLGEWSQAEGLVFDNYSDELNVTDEADYKEGRPVYWACDDGYVKGDGLGSISYHPRIIQLWQHNDWGGLDCFYEYVATGETHEVSIANVLALPYPRPDVSYVDGSAAMFRGELHKHGLQTVNGTHVVVEGIKAVRQLLCDGVGLRLLRIHPRCQNLRYEFQSYQYDPESRAISGELKPLKLNDHSIDACRYIVYGRRLFLQALT